MKQEALSQEDESHIAELESKLEMADKALEQLRELIPTLIEISHLDHDLNTPLCIISLSLSRVKRLGIELNDEGLQNPVTRLPKP